MEIALMVKYKNNARFMLENFLKKDKIETFPFDLEINLGIIFIQ
jgi:hypothetical protein